MGRTRSLLLQWGLLAAALLAGADLALRDHQPHYTAPRPPRPIYSLRQVVSGWERAPQQWVGRTIYVGTSAAFACEVASYDQSVHVTADPSYCRAPSPIMLIDPYGGVAIASGYKYSADFPRYEYLAASYPPGATIPTPTPTPVFRVHLASRPDCGGLEPGRHPCLVAEPAGWVIP